MIAGFPRNIFKYNVKIKFFEGRALFVQWGPPALLSIIKLRIANFFFSRQTLDAKVQSQEGNSPDYLLRPLNFL